MLSDKLQAKQSFVQKREQFEAQYQRLFDDIVEYVPGNAMSGFAAELNSLLMIHAELVQAPVLYTLQSAAEVGFSHAQIGRPMVMATEEESREADERTRDIKRRMGQEDSDNG